MENQASTSQVVLSDFVQLVAGMGRALFGLAKLPAFTGDKLSLTQWVALSVLSQSEGISNKQLAGKLGVSGQRINQITTELSRFGLITIKVSAKDFRMNELRLSPDGWRVLDAINRELEPLITATFAGRERLLVRANNSIRLLLKLVKSARSPNPKPTEPRR